MARSCTHTYRQGGRDKKKKENAVNGSTRFLFCFFLLGASLSIKQASHREGVFRHVSEYRQRLVFMMFFFFFVCVCVHVCALNVQRGERLLLLLTHFFSLSFCMSQWMPCGRITTRLEETARTSSQEKLLARTTTTTAKKKKKSS